MRNYNDGEYNDGELGFWTASLIKLIILLNIVGFVYNCKTHPSVNGDEKPIGEVKAETIMDQIANQVLSKYPSFVTYKDETRKIEGNEVTVDRLYASDTDGNGEPDLLHFLNYVDLDAGEVPQIPGGVINMDRVKAKEIIKSDITTEQYVRDVF